jgi:hypothetical protein
VEAIPREEQATAVIDLTSGFGKKEAASRAVDFIGGSEASVDSVAECDEPRDLSVGPVVYLGNSVWLGVVELLTILDPFGSPPLQIKLTLPVFCQRIIVFAGAPLLTVTLENIDEKLEIEVATRSGVRRGTFVHHHCRRRRSVVLD